MERPGTASEASASRDAPAYDYGSFSGYRSSFSGYSHNPPSVDILPTISRDSHAGYSDLLNRGNPRETVGDGIPENYSYASSYDDMRRRYGYGSDAGSYLSGSYTGETFDGKLSYGYESYHRPSTATLSTSGFPQDVGKLQDAASEPARRLTASHEQIPADGFYNRMGSQKNDLDYRSKLDVMSYERPVSGDWHTSEREFSYPPRDYNVRYGQSPSVYHDRATVAGRDDKNTYLLESKFDSSVLGSHLPSSGPWSDWRSAGEVQKSQEGHEWKGSSSFSGIGPEPDGLGIVASASSFMDGSAYGGLRGYDKPSIWNGQAVMQAQFDTGQRRNESSFLHTNHVGKVTDSTEASMQVQGVPLPKSAKEEKKRRTRWGPVEESAKGSQDGAARQKKKSRWSAEKSPVKEVRPTDILKELSRRGSDIVALRARLLIIETMLQTGQVLGNERSPSPEPVFDDCGFRVNTREQRAREKLSRERQRIMTRLSELTTPGNLEEGKSSKLSKKIYIPVDKFPNYNFIGLIIGPRGHTQKNMEKESGAKIFIRGKGSVKEGDLITGIIGERENLHVLIEADSEESIKKATEMVEKLLIPVEDKQNEHKQAQLRELASLNGTLRPIDICNKFKEGGLMAKDCPVSSSAAVDQKGRVAAGPSITAVQKGGVAAGPSITAAVQKGGVAAGPSITAVQKGGVAAGFSITAIQKGGNSENFENDNSVIYVESLPVGLGDDQLSNLFSPFGQIVHANVMRHPTTGLSKSYGFVKFLDERDAAQAVALMNGYQLDQRVLVVKFKTKAEPAS